MTTNNGVVIAGIVLVCFWWWHKLASTVVMRRDGRNEGVVRKLRKLNKILFEMSQGLHGLDWNVK